jgi:putative ABC transport system permease protein
VVRAARVRGRGFLIAAEMSVALLLLVCAGLMIRTLGKLNAVNPGFDARNVMSMIVFAPPAEKDGAKRIASFERVRQTLAAAPGVEQVSGTNHLPIGGDVWGLGYLIPGRPAPPPEQRQGAVYRVALPGYFGAMRIPLVRGRDFRESDNADSMPVAIVNERLARSEWPGRDAVGKMIEIPGLPAAGDRKSAAATMTIIGVSTDVRQGDWAAQPSPEFYVPYLQHADAWDAKQITFVVRGTGLRRADIERRVRAISPEIAVSDAASMDEVIGDKLWRSRTAAALLSLFAGIALALAAVGVYGAISHSVRQRAREIAIRLALGAPARHILQIGIRESGVALACGLIGGVAGSMVATRLISTLLYQVQPADPATFATVIVVLGGVAVAAAVIPAWGALRRNKELTLREE